jgi:hypothetical protein
MSPEPAVERVRTFLKWCEARPRTYRHPRLATGAAQGSLAAKAKMGLYRRIITKQSAEPPSNHHPHLLQPVTTPESRT